MFLVWKGDGIWTGEHRAPHSHNMFDVIGQYCFIEKIGTGFSGDIFLAEHKFLKVVRVVKRIPKNHTMYGKLIKEAEILKNLNHPGIPVLYDTGEDEGYFYLIEEYIKGESLQTHLIQKNELSQEIIIDFGIQICNILEYLHNMRPFPLLYLDLKPEHIFICNGTTIRLVDYGAVLKNDGKSIAISVGTEGFAAPEQYKNGILDCRADIYAVGAVFYYMVHGKCKDRKDTDMSWYRKYQTREFKIVMDKCMHENPESRYPDVTKLKTQLLELVNQTDTVKSNNSSQIIAIAGCMPRAGSTHLAISLAVYFNRRGYSCLYVEKNYSGMLHAVLQENPKATEQEGIIYYKNFYGLPQYGEGVNVKEVIHTNEHMEIIIRDYGNEYENNLDEFLEANQKIILLGGKEWETFHTKQTVQAMQETNEIIWVYNWGGAWNSRKVFCHRAGTKIFSAPCYENPWEPNKIADKFFDELLQKKWKKREGGVFHKKKRQN